jgi:hypothetical protein
MSIRPQEPTSPVETSDGAIVLTPDEIRAAIDVEARKRLHMSGVDFIRRWQRHELPDTAAASDIAILVGMLYPNGRPPR